MTTPNKRNELMNRQEDYQSHYRDLRNLLTKSVAETFRRGRAENMFEVHDWIKETAETVVDDLLLTKKIMDAITNLNTLGLELDADIDLFNRENPDNQITV